MKRLLTTLAAVAALTLAGMGAAGASTPGTDGNAQLDRGLELAAQVSAAQSPQEAYAALDYSDQKALAYAVTPVETVLLESYTRALEDEAQASLAAESGSVTPYASGCWQSWKRWGAKATAGNTLYTWWQGLNWCGNGSSITSYSRYDRGGETSTPGWSYLGAAGATYNNVGWEVRSRTQEKFQLSVLGNVVQTPVECGQIRGGAGGLTSNSTSCSL